MPSNSFHELTGECQAFPFVFFPSLLFFVSSFANCSHSAKPPLSPPFHPHSYVERLSLGARWVYLTRGSFVP